MKYRYNVRTGISKIKTKTSIGLSTAALGFGGLAMAVALPLSAKAASTVVVTPNNTQGWVAADQRPGGNYSYNTDPTAPGTPHNGALEITTDSSTNAKVQYMHAANTALSDVNELSYSTKQVSGPPEAAASYQIAVNLNGTSGFTTLVYEPYWNGTVTPGGWQTWNVAGGLFWSSRSVTCSNGTIVGMAGGPATYTLASIEAACPDAVVTGFGVNVGTFNTNYDVETDLVDFNGTTYNFEPYQTPADKDACKDGGWQSLSDQTGNAFRNQGQCVSWTNGRGQ